MVFTDLLFLFGFLPLIWALYAFWIRKTRLIHWYLWIVSLLFYSFGSLRSLFWLLAFLGFNFILQYVLGLLVLKKAHQKSRKENQKAKGPPPFQKKPQPKEASYWLLLVGVMVDVGLLFVFKYFGPWFQGLFPWSKGLASTMPLGLSFYTFSCLSCLFDVYRQKKTYESSFVRFGLFAAFFGWVNMGPIANYAQLKDQIDHPKYSRAQSAKGMALFIQGLFRKVVLADNLALVVTSLANDFTWVGQVAYGCAYFLQLYFDFAGYSRMARGCACLFGFDIPKNFDLPLSALSIQDFWRRWHISLTSWFREYVYIPLGGNRVSNLIWMRNLFCVWLLTGLWHGPSSAYLAWGIYQALLILLEKWVWKGTLQTLSKWIRHGYVLILELFGMALFSAPNIGMGFWRIGHYFGLGLTGFWNAGTLFWVSNMGIYFVVGVWLAFGFSKRFSQVFFKNLKHWRIWQILGYLAMLIVCLIFLISASSQTFLYAEF